MATFWESQCPQCFSKDVTSKPIKIEALGEKVTGLRQECECNQCLYEWEEVSGVKPGSERL